MTTLGKLLSVLGDEFTHSTLALPVHPSLRDIPITKLTSDSRGIAEGTLYVAVKGTLVDGHSFLSDVMAHGASFAIGERPAAEFGIPEVRYLQVPDSRAAIGILASEMERNPSHEMLVIGITGTSGKTTTSYLVESILHAAGKKVGLIGTVSYRLDGKEIPSTHTTPGPVELQQLIHRMHFEGCNALVMEVSSHALKQSRAIGVSFDGAVFTNLSAEHLDYHPDMEDYYLSKKILFSEQASRSHRWKKSPRFAVHVGSAYGDRLLSELAAGEFARETSSFQVDPETRIDARGIRGVFSGIELHSKLIGRFNAENIAGAVAITKALGPAYGISDAAIRAGIENIVRVPGRLDQVPDPAGRVILVDYAHKPDALEKVLEVLRPMRKPKTRLVCVVGCGGDRDRAKRPIMGKIACRLADFVIFTSDNPRTEAPEKILEEMESSCAEYTNWIRDIDRAAAIEAAIADTNAGDIVLIAGKGHEDYQIIGTQKVHFDDREVAAEALKRNEPKGLFRDLL